MSTRLGASLLAVIFAALSGSVWGQINTGRITGSVLDPSGAIVGDVAIRAVNEDTGVVTTTQGGAPLPERQDLREAGYTVQQIGGGDYVVRIRHVKSGEISIGLK